MINEAKLIIAEAKESRLNYAVTGHDFDRIKANMYSIFECYANGIIDWNVSKSKLKTAIREYIHLYPKDERAVEIEIMREEYKRINKYYKQALDAYRVVSEEKMTNKLVAKQKLDESVAKHHSDVFYNKRTLSESELKDISTLQTWDRVMEAYPHLTRHDEDCVRMLENTYDTKDFEFNPRAGHRDQMSHPENLGLDAEPNKLYSPRPKLRPKKLAPATSPRPRMRPANLQMRHDINKALQQAITSEGHSPHKKGTAKYKAHMAAMHAEADENNNGSSTGDKIAQAVGYGLPAGYIAYQMRDRLKGLGQRGANAVKNIPKNIDNKKIARQAAADVVRKGQHAARTGLTSIQGGKGSVPDTRTTKPHLRPIDGGRPPRPAAPKPPSPQATNIGGGGGKGKPSLLKRAGKTAANIGKGVLGKAALPLAVGIAGYDAARGWKADPNATVGQKFKNAGNSALHGMSFGLLGKDPTNEEVFEYLLQAGITEEALTEWAMEGYKIMPPMDDKYQPRDGLEGPFSTLSGKVVYYDPKEGSYYDPDTDMYMSYDEFHAHDNDYGDMKDEHDEVKEAEEGYDYIAWPDEKTKQCAIDAIGYGIQSNDAYEYIVSNCGNEHNEWLEDNKEDILAMFDSYGLSHFDEETTLGQDIWEEIRNKAFQQFDETTSAGAIASVAAPMGKMKRRKDSIFADKESKQTAISEAQFDEAAGEKDACYRKVKSRYKVWPSAYASGALVKCRKVGADNWGNSKKK